MVRVHNKTFKLYTGVLGCRCIALYAELRILMRHSGPNQWPIILSLCQSLRQPR